MVTRSMKIPTLEYSYQEATLQSKLILYIISYNIMFTDSQMKHKNEKKKINK